MIEQSSIRKENHAADGRPRTVAIVGPDLDLDLCRVLTAGDKVLAEVNGVRYGSGHKNPLAAELPWEVMSNEPSATQGAVGWTGKLVLRHPRMNREIVLGYENAMEFGRSEPAVFVTHDDSIQRGTLYVILQAVAFYLPADRVGDMFSPLSDSESRDALADRDFTIDSIRKSWHSLGMLKDSDDGHGKWGYDGVTRFALRTQLLISTVKALRAGNFDEAMRLNREGWSNVRRELHWLPMLLQQSSLIQHDAEAIYIAPSLERSG